MKTISKKAMQIIKKGGYISKEDFDFLSQNMPCEYYYRNYDNKIQSILLIYLHEVRGYCFVANKTYYYSPDDGFFVELCKSKLDYYDKNGYPEMLLFYEDLEHKQVFITYSDLKNYTINNNIIRKEPLENDKFKSFLDYGEVNGWNEMWYFMKYRNYILFDEKRMQDVAVFVKQNGARIYLPVQYVFDNERGYPTEKIDYDQQARIFCGNGKGGFMVDGEIIEDYLDDFIFENSNIIN